MIKNLITIPIFVIVLGIVNAQAKSALNEAQELASHIGISEVDYSRPVFSKTNPYQPEFFAKVAQCLNTVIEENKCFDGKNCQSDFPLLIMAATKEGYGFEGIAMERFYSEQQEKVVDAIVIYRDFTQDECVSYISTTL